MKLGGYFFFKRTLNIWPEINGKINLANPSRAWNGRVTLLEEKVMPGGQTEQTLFYFWSENSNYSYTPFERAEKLYITFLLISQKFKRPVREKKT